MSNDRNILTNERVTDEVLVERIEAAQALLSAGYPSRTMRETLLIAIELQERRGEVEKYKAWAAACDLTPPEPSADAREDRAYYNGARQAAAMAHQSLDAMDDWIESGCGGRGPVVNRRNELPVAEPLGSPLNRTGDA
jgi:hypothetical protein